MNGLPWKKDDLTDHIERARDKHPELAGLCFTDYAATHAFNYVALVYLVC
jgi:hypothetical protein